MALIRTGGGSSAITNITSKGQTNDNNQDTSVSGLNVGDYFILTAYKGSDFGDSMLSSMTGLTSISYSKYNDGTSNTYSQIFRIDSASVTFRTKSVFNMAVMN